MSTDHELVSLHLGDCIEIMRTLPANSVDAVVTDPPYGLEFMGKEWDSFGVGKRPNIGQADGSKFRQNMGTPSFTAQGNPTCKNCGGDKYRNGPRKCSCDTPNFGNPHAASMRGFQAWCELWATECLRVLKPGGHMLAFGGTRTWHRLAAAVEDVGFEVRDSIAWLYGSGFPKSLDVSKAIDKRGGNPGLAIEIAAAIKTARESRGWTAGRADRHFCGGTTNWTWFEGRGGDCRPPAPATFARIVAEWPELAGLAAKVAEVEREVIGQSAHRSGIGNATAGHYTIGGTVAEHVDITAPATPAAEQWNGWGTALKPAFEPIVVARKPLTGTVAANVLSYGTGALNIDACRTALKPASAHEGGRWPTNVILDGESADKLDRENAPSCSRVGKPRGAAAGDGWRMTATGAEYDDHGGPSRYFPTFRYQAKAPTRERVTVEGVAHPTVKPLELMRWLVRLVTPPGGTVLEPFAGSGTTVEAAIREGFRCIATERDPTYLPLIHARIARTAPSELPTGSSQLDLFDGVA